MKSHEVDFMNLSLYVKLRHAAAAAARHFSRVQLYATEA